MTATPPLTRDIGQTERALQTLIQRQLTRAGVGFPEWVALTLLSGPGTLTAGDLARRLADDAIAQEGEASIVVRKMVERGLIGPGAGDGDPDATPLMVTDAGAAVHAPLRASIGELTIQLFADIEESDLDATRRTLSEVRQRARQLLG